MPITVASQPQPTSNPPLANGQDGQDGPPKVPSLDDIVEKSFSEMGATVQVPLGDAPRTTTPSGSPNPFSSQPLPQPQPSADPSQLLNELNSLESEIDSASLDGKSGESLRSFEALKSRYKNNIAKFKEQISNLDVEKTALAKQLRDAAALEEDAKRARDAELTANVLREDNEKLKKENEQLIYFRRKYDLENDPQIRQEFINPMEELKANSINILENSDADGDAYWDALLSADSEYRVNFLIQDAGIDGLNAQSLKQYVTTYKNLKNNYSKISSPEIIDAALNTAKGRSLQNSEKLAEDVFGTLKKAFSEHVRELRESDINKEHNFFVYDSVVEKAEKSFKSLRSALGPEYQNTGVMGTLAQAALMTAAYPAQKQLVDHLVKVNQELIKELRGGGSPVTRQTKESQPPKDLNDIRKLGSKSLDDIVSEAFTNKS